MINLKNNARAFGTFLTIAAGLSLASLALADTCRQVDLKLKNDGTHLVKVSSALFKCEGETEKRERFPDVEVQAGQLKTVATNQNFPGCKGKKMEFIEYEYRVWCDGRWSTERAIRDRDFLNPFCSSKTGKVYTVQLPSTTCD